MSIKIILIIVISTLIFTLLYFKIHKKLDYLIFATPKVIDVTDAPYNADPLGKLDSTVAIQDAINDISEKGGGKVHLPKGHYKVTKSLKLHSNVSLEGSGDSTVIKANFPKPGNPIITNEINTRLYNVVLKDFKIDRTDKNTEHGILLANVSKFVADGIIIYSSYDRPGGALGISAFDEYAKYPSENITVRNSYFYYTGNFGIQYGNVKNGVITNNKFSNGYREIIGVEPYGEKGLAQDIIITNNFIWNKDVTYNGTPTGKLIITDSSGGVAKEILVKNNVIQEEIDMGNNLPGIAVYGSEKVEVINNTISNIGGIGIMITSTYGKAAEKILIKGNKVINCSLRGAYGGIKLKDTFETIISENYVYGSEHSYDILEEGTSEKNRFLNNILHK